MYFAAIELHISIAAEPVFTVFGFPVTNALLTGILGTIIVVSLLGVVAWAVKTGRYNRFVGLVQWVFEGLLKQINDIIPDKTLARRITPLAVTIFFFVLINYWLSILPGVDSIRVDGVPLIRSLTADLNFTLALAIVTVVTVQIYAFRYLGVYGNAHRYFRNPLKDPIGAFEGLLELVGEFSRGIALSLRLFGNAFAGEVLLVIIAFLTGYLAAVTLPFFMVFELFIGFIQAYVFFVLTLIFTALAVSHHEPDSNHSPAAHPKKAALRGK
ncbi:ATP synthase subunit A [Candidatus Saccharibacteria bacterium]|nr:ATP synthase subunit A [Candidatus Saccharibacteria bacterium]MBJ58844.1 ATP synthase subunit A [Candidatus Saccharibacteria bacterium]MBQ68482.1 ATP synthase subunit A [Candidatus Saccharibacteria bacterium]|tara:strand:+ start:2652 stop:3461 length:810 start_codon:yes stop_codon:yes gene_type:complete